MALNSKDNYGKPISKKLSEYLRKYTSADERADVAISVRIGTSTIRDVTYRKNSLTEDNSKAIIELMRIAIKNCEKEMSAAKTAKVEISKIL